MYIAIVPNRNSKPAVLLRENWREGKKIRKRTLANLTDWPQAKIDALRTVLKNQTVPETEPRILIERSIPHGHVEAVLTTIRKIGLGTMISSHRRRELDLAMAMIVARILRPGSRPENTGLWNATTLAEQLGVEQADEADCHLTLSWLLDRRPDIENLVAARHLTEGATALYYVTGGHYSHHSDALKRLSLQADDVEGRPCTLYGMLANDKGCPITVEAYPGNTGNPDVVPRRIANLMARFDLDRIVVIGDRKTLTHAQIERLKEHPRIGWISALRSRTIASLASERELRGHAFGENNCLEIGSAVFPAERLIACYSATLAEELGSEREQLLSNTAEELSKTAEEMSHWTDSPPGKAEIARKVGKVLGRFRMGKYFTVRIEDGTLSYARKDHAVARDARLDGLNVIRTSEPAGDISAEEAAHWYKSHRLVERTIREPVRADLLVRPIMQRSADHTHAHLFLAMLAYYVKWHMRKALAPVLPDDEQLEPLSERRYAAKSSDSSSSARINNGCDFAPESLRTQSLKALLAELGTLCRNTYRLGPNSGVVLCRPTEQTLLQKKAFDLLEAYRPGGE